MHVRQQRETEGPDGTAELLARTCDGRSGTARVTGRLHARGTAAGKMNRESQNSAQLHSVLHHLVQCY